MAKRSLIDQLDATVETVLARPDAALPSAAGGKLAALARIAADLRDLPSEDFKARLKAELERSGSMTNQKATRAVKPIREGFHTVTPYLAVREAEELIAFVKQAFGAEGQILGIGSQGGLHAEFRIGDSMLMIGGGEAWRGTPRPAALHFYVKDADAVYQRALQAGATSLYAPMDQDYGDREAGVKDVSGNYWFIATHKGASHIPGGLRSVTPYLLAQGAGHLADFLKRAFGAEEVERAEAKEGIVLHAKMRIGDSVVEMGEARGELLPMPTTFYLYVDDVDAWYQRAVQGGATSLQEPADQPYGDRTAAVKDPFGNDWYGATHIKDVPM